jgi:hypothetical protein
MADFRNSSVGIAMRYELDSQGSIFVAGARDFSLVHSVQTSPWAHPASYPTGTGGKAAGA